MKVYEGRETCQGCGRPGTESTRPQKDALCFDCQRALDIGRQVIAEGKVQSEYANVFVHWHHFYDEECNKAIHTMLEQMENPDAAISHYAQLSRHADGNNGRRYKIPMQFFKALDEFVCTFGKAWCELKTQRANIPKEAAEAVRQERNRIYNEGVAYGRNLLTQLNRGEIGVNDFEGIVEKY